MQLVGHQKRVRRLVQLGAEGVGRGLAVDEAVARHRPVRLLLALEQEQGGSARRRQISDGHQARPDLVEVSGEHLAVGAEVGVPWVAGRDRLAPGRGHAGDDRAGEGLVFGGLQHVGVHEVRVAQAGGPRLRDPREAPRRLVERPVVGVPALLRVVAHRVEVTVQGSLGRLHRGRLARAEAESHREGDIAALRVAARDPCRLDDVAAARRRVRRRQRARGVELCEPVAGGPGEAARDLCERRIEGCVDRLCVVAVDGVRRRVRVGGDEDGVAGGGVGGGRVCAPVPAAAAAVSVHRRIEAEIEAQVAVSSCPPP